MATQIFDLSSADSEPAYLFDDSTPVLHAVMYCESAKRDTLKWFFSVSEEERIKTLQPTIGKRTIACGDFAAFLPTT